MRISPNSPLEDFQKLNSTIYQKINDRGYEFPNMLSRLLRHVGRILKGVRKEKYTEMEYHLCMSLSWVLAQANKGHFDVASEMWKRFPGFCPYCLGAPCSCRIRARSRKKFSIRNKKRPISIGQWQEMFGRIYPNDLRAQATHLAEEVIELDEAIGDWTIAHREPLFVKITDELIDVVTNILGVANCLGMDLSVGMVAYFAKGCPGCHQRKCSCGCLIKNKPIIIGAKTKKKK